MKPNKITILVANYNNGKYIRECIDSVVNQTSSDWELLIIDDASSDESVIEINTCLSVVNSPKIRFLANEVNLGYVDTLIKLINNANTDIVGILDADDKLSPYAVEKVLHEYTSNQDIGFVYSKYYECDDKMRVLRTGFSKRIPANMSGFDGDFVSHFKTFKKSIYEKTEGYNKFYLYAEDRDLILKMEEVTKFKYIDLPLYYYRMVAGSQSRDKLKKRIGEITHNLALYNAYLRRSKSKQTPNYNINYLNYRLYDRHPLYNLKERILFTLRYKLGIK